jgi:hypothetical protein
MKKLLGLSLSIVLAVPAIALAQSGSQSSGSQSGSSADQSSGQYGSQSSGQMGQSGSMGQSSASEAVKGTVSQDGKTLVGDDGKSWTIANPDAVKGHEGHHVVLKGSADATTNQIQVSSVKMMKEKGSKHESGNPGAGTTPQ